MTTRIERITQVLSTLNPEILEIIDDSKSHHGHFGIDAQSSETHLKLRIKATWEVQSLLEKHRKINELVKDEFDLGLHALNIQIL